MEKSHKYHISKKEIEEYIQEETELKYYGYGSGAEDMAVERVFSNYYSEEYNEEEYDEEAENYLRDEIRRYHKEKNLVIVYIESEQRSEQEGYNEDGIEEWEEWFSNSMGIPL